MPVTPVLSELQCRGVLICPWTETGGRFNSAFPASSWAGSMRSVCGCVASEALFGAFVITGLWVDVDSEFVKKENCYGRREGKGD